METELKLSLDPADVAALRAHPVLQRHAAKQARAIKIADRYFDTPDLHLWKHGAGLRVRKTRDGWMQTLKGGGSAAGGLHIRHEWESRVAKPKPELSDLRDMVEADSEWAHMLDLPGLQKALQCIFSTRIERTLWLLHPEPGVEVELALDQGHIAHGKQGLEVCEIELELKAGKPARLFELALELMDGVPLRICRGSKAQRGYALHAPQAGAILRAQQLHLPRTASIDEGWRCIAANCLAQVHGNEVGVLEGADPESVHQMRVGLRRLRSAFGLFGEVIFFPPTLRGELTWLANALGAARDWEVLLESSLPAVAAKVDVADLKPLRKAIREIAQEERSKAAAALDSTRYARLALELGAWLEGTRWRTGLRAQQEKRLQGSLRDFAGELLSRRHAALRKRGKGITHADAARWHRLRIAVKKARYAAEFFQSLYPAKRQRAYIAALAALQESLGWFNDMAVADGLLRKIQESPSATNAQAGAAAFVRGWLTRESDAFFPQMAEQWRRFKKKAEKQGF